MTAPILVRGGRVIDPADGVDAILDLLIRDGRIAEILYMDARSTDLARPAEPYWFALEVPRGR